MDFFFLRIRKFLVLVEQGAKIRSRPARNLVTKPIPAELSVFAVKGHNL